MVCLHMAQTPLACLVGVVPGATAGRLTLASSTGMGGSEEGIVSFGKVFIREPGAFEGGCDGG